MAGPWDNMNPELASRVQALIAASGGRISPGSGFRTVEEQAALRRKNGCPDVYKSPASSCRIPTAIPGRSNHNHGLAMDLVYSKDGAQWAAQNAARFGLHFPVKGENWHVEMIDDDGSRSHVHGAQRGGAIGFDMEWQSEQRTPQDELSYRLDSILGIIGGKGPGQQASDALVQEGELAQDTTTLEPSQPQGQMTQGATRVAQAAGDRLGNAQIIAQVGREMGAPDRAIQIALAAALVESELENVNHGDRDSLGLFQQRPSKGWGTPQQVMDPRYAARQFYSRLLKLNWQGMDPGRAAQAVQRSAYPDRYGKRMGEAQSIFNQLAGQR